MRQIVDTEISKIYNQLQINATKICTFNSDKWAEELVSHTLESFLNQPLSKQYKIVTSPSAKVSALERYITRAMSLAIHSSSSPFYHKHRRAGERMRELFPNIDYVKEYGADNPNETHLSEQEVYIKKFVGDLHFYEKYLIQQHYYGEKTIAEMSKETGIPTSTISKDIKKTLRKLKEQVEKTY